MPHANKTKAKQYSHACHRQRSYEHVSHTLLSLTKVGPTMSSSRAPLCCARQARSTPRYSADPTSPGARSRGRRTVPMLPAKLMYTTRLSRTKSELQGQQHIHQMASTRLCITWPAQAFDKHITTQCSGQQHMARHTPSSSLQYCRLHKHVCSLC